MGFLRFFTDVLREYGSYFFSFLLHCKVQIWKIRCVSACSKGNAAIELTSMTYKTIVIGYAPKAREMAAAIERTANERALDGWELVTFSVTNSAKAILVFRVPNAVRQKEPISEESDNENR